MGNEDLSRRKLLWLGAVGLVSGLAGGTAFLRGRSSKIAPSIVPSTAVPPTVTTTTMTTAAAPTATMLAAPKHSRRVICREAWGAAGSKPYKKHTIERLTVHHTAGLLTDNSVAPNHLRSYQRTHQSRGMADFAYHLFIDGHGNIYEGRDITVVGQSFTSYDPTGHLLVVLDGNFEEQPVPAAQVDALVDVLAWATVEYGVSTSTIKGHRDYVSTACPGKALYAIVKDGSLAARAEDRIHAGVTLEPVCGSSADALIRAIRSGNA